MLQTMIDKGVTGESVSALEKLIELHERMEIRQGEKDFAAAFVQLQSEMVNVKAEKIVPDKQGNKKFAFAPYEDIMKAVAPLLTKHGFTVTFTMRFSEGRIIAVCTLMHTGGHSRTNEFCVRIGSGPPGCNESQADGAASTYAKRFALCNCLNISISHVDADDAKVEGTFISAKEAANLRDWAEAVGADTEKFLIFAGVGPDGKFEQIRTARLTMLHEFLQKKERANATPKGTTGGLL